MFKVIIKDVCTREAIDLPEISKHLSRLVLSSIVLGKGAVFIHPLEGIVTIDQQVFQLANEDQFIDVCTYEYNLTYYVTLQPPKHEPKEENPNCT